MTVSDSSAIFRILSRDLEKRAAENEAFVGFFTSLAGRIRLTRDRFRADKYCNVHFSLGGFQTLLKLQTLSNTDAWFRNVSDSLPILLVSGADDPVGNYGKGVAKVFSLLKKRGKNVKMKLYPGCRHEILNDVCRDMVIRDILRFIND